MKKLIIVLLFITANLSFAQIKMQGVVKDSIGTTLELANIIAINQETSALESYAITNEKGNFTLSLGKNGNYKFQVSHIGMKNFEAIISTLEENISRDFVLQLDNILDTVELTYEMPVRIQGDTIVYNADSFKNGSERKLEDVLEKLPGVEINEEGQVEVEGKVVNKLMVNGKDFFDGDSKLATKNIPSNAVDKIQVLRNYSEVGQLRGVTNNQDNVAINIKLKGKIDDLGGVTAMETLIRDSETGEMLVVIADRVKGKMAFFNAKNYTAYGGARQVVDIWTRNIVEALDQTKEGKLVHIDKEKTYVPYNF
jgi:hypothetical protein